MRASNKEVTSILDTAKGAGWTVKVKQNGWMLLSPNRRNAVMVHGTNSDHRALKNVKSVLRSAGLKV